MSITMAINRDFEQAGDKWRPMLILSIVLHTLIFFSFFLGTCSRPSDGLRMNEVVYEVDLVSPSEISQPEGPVAVSSSQSPVTRTVSSENRQARRIFTPSKREGKVPLATKISKRITPKQKKSKISSDRVLDSAISGIEKKVKKEDDSDYLEKVIAGLEKKSGLKTGSSGEKSSGKGSVASSIATRMYQAQVESKIKKHWAYPDALGSQKNMEAVVLLKVSKDGTVLNTRFVKRSKNSVFDESVIKAIEKAKSMPPLYEGFKGNYEELEINFNLKDLE